MSLQVRTEGDLCRVRVESEMSIYTASEIKGQLMVCLMRAPRMELDLSGVSELDTAGVQLLMLLKREALARGQELILTGHTPVVTDTLDLLGLAGWFGDPIVLPERPAG